MASSCGYYRGHLEQQVMYLQRAGKYQRPAWRLSQEQTDLDETPQGFPVALSSRVTPSTPVVWTHVACSGHLIVLFPTPCVLTPPLAEATVARERAAFRARSRHGPSIPPPWPVYRTATAWPSRCRW